MRAAITVDPWLAELPNDLDPVPEQDIDDEPVFLATLRGILLWLVWMMTGYEGGWAD